MPRGYYLGQGLIPLGYSSSDDDEGPCELPDGRLVCGPHGFVVCGKCCVDYSFMDDVLSNQGNGDDEEEEDDDEDSGVLGPPLRKGTGRSWPSKFIPSLTTDTPAELFSGRRQHIRVKRYTHRDDASTVLIRTDGACLDNGQANPKAGWAFWHGVSDDGTQLIASASLEAKGPFGAAAAQTSNRAELRAVIAALRFRHWPGEGFRTFVVATDSEYVVEGATKWAKTWMENGWKTSAGNDVKNKDLWQALLGEIERASDNGLAVQFWRIPREWNTVADAAAKSAAAREAAPSQWTEMMGINI
ncbi:ribonuclease H-like domain-containing protein [Chaetomium sp. MPI-CAGE-AT-0009]|nr:ribonuclease H-like domain-containing protein [Chaetomium sp. MPI-CAGE-AT-0009]